MKINAKQYTAIAITLLILRQGKSQDSLEDLYFDLSNIYRQYLERVVLFSANQLKTWGQPIDIVKRHCILTEYDFIIIGSGSAGSVLANRLSEINDWRILLLEAGKGEDLFTRIPVATGAMLFTHYNWDYLAEYQANMSYGFENQRMRWPRGKALGGSSVINYMVYARGNKLDYDRWAAAGNPGWSYQDVLPYFMKSENANLRDADHRYHGHRGPLSVADIYQSELVRSFIEGGKELGLPHIDYNANVQSLGVSPIQATVLRGTRHSAARAFLYPIRDRPNLQMVTSAFVTKILIDPISKTAYGVEYEKNCKKYRVEARKEVILSAGTLNSPQLLMLAGIGPKQHLQQLGIDVLQDLPVGDNLQDHITYPGLSFLLDQELSLSASSLLNYTSISNFLLHGQGPYTSLGGVEAIGFIKTEVSRDVEDFPDVELLFLDGSLSTDYGLINRRWMNIRDDIYNAVYTPTHNIPTWTVFPMLLHPKSKGHLKLQSTDSHDAPLFYGNYFTDPEQQDLETILAGIRFIQRLSETRAFQRIGSRLNPNRIPGCDLHQFDSDNYWRCAIRSISGTIHHQVGTAKMGPPDDPSSVVNHELKVYGIGNLRVADCSVIPFAPGGHTNAIAIMIGEKAADIIKDNWGRLL